MKKIINHLSIKNFKSIENLELDCNKINVFIGEPNVGKSNILEALSLFEINYIIKSKYSLKKYLRIKSPENLFYFNNKNLPIEIESNLDKLTLRRVTLENTNSTEKEYYYEIVKNDILNSLDQKFNYPDTSDLPDNLKINKRNYDFLLDLDAVKYKKYDYEGFAKLNVKEEPFLSFPLGRNIIQLLKQDRELIRLISSLFAHSGYQLLIEKNELLIQRVLDNSVAISIPFIQIADTLQRMIFYFAAIYSNKESILIFEEPEVHSFPPYVAALAQEILQSETNQFFIATHSPYLLNEVLEKCAVEDVNIFVTYLKDFNTQVRLLTSDEISELLNYGVDIFFNIDKYAGE